MLQDCCPDNECCRWAVGSNMPGYMPNSEPFHFETYDDALECHLDDIERALGEEAEANENGIEDLEAEFHRYLRMLERCCEEGKQLATQFHLGDYVYWLEPL